MTSVNPVQRVDDIQLWGGWGEVADRYKTPDDSDQPIIVPAADSTSIGESNDIKPAPDRISRFC